MYRKLLIALCIFSFALFSCSKSDTSSEVSVSEKKIVLGFAQLGDESDWRSANTESIKTAAREAGIELKFSDAQQSQENQIRAIRSFIAQRVDVIAFAPIVRNGWDNVLREAKEAGIPVILADRDVDTVDKSLYVSFIGSDFYEEGKKAAEWLIINQEKLGLKGDINIVELQGTIGSSPAILRKVGFEDAIKKYKNIKIIKSESADFMRSKGREVMDTFLLSEGKVVNVLYSHNDDMALGAIESIEAAGLKPGKDVIVISIDATREAFKAMIEGKMNCTIECNPMMGPELMSAVHNIMKGERIPSKILSKVNVFSQDNALLEVEKRKY